GGDHVTRGRRLRLVGHLLAPEGSHAALDGLRRRPARHQLFFVEDAVGALVSRLGVVERVHADGVARTGLGTQTTHNAPQFIDLEDLGALLDPAVGRLFRDDGDAVGGADRGAHHAGDAADLAVVTQHEAVEAP